MLNKLRSQTIAWVLFGLSLVWAAASNGPVLYSLFVPSQDIQLIIRTLEGRATLPADLAPLSQEITASAGLLRWVIPIGAYWHVSADYNVKQSHATRTTHLS